MAKPGRNDRCPCGSGKKYKACCLTKDEAVEHERLAAAQAQRENQAAEKRQSLREVRAAMLAKLAGWTTPSPHSKTRSWPESQNSTRLPPADLTTHDHGP